MYRSVTAEEAKLFSKEVRLVVAGPDNTKLEATAYLERLVRKDRYRYRIKVDGRSHRPFYYSCDQVRMFAAGDKVLLDPFGYNLRSE